MCADLKCFVTFFQSRDKMMKVTLLWLELDWTVLKAIHYKCYTCSSVNSESTIHFCVSGVVILKSLHCHFTILITELIYTVPHFSDMCISIEEL